MYKSTSTRGNIYSPSYSGMIQWVKFSLLTAIQSLIGVICLVFLYLLRDLKDNFGINTELKISVISMSVFVAVGVPVSQYRWDILGTNDIFYKQYTAINVDQV